MTPAPLPVGPVDLGDRDAFADEATAQARTAGAGALDADPHDIAVAAQPPKQPSTASGTRSNDDIATTRPAASTAAAT